MKHIGIIFLLVACLILSLSACRSDEHEDLNYGTDDPQASSVSVSETQNVDDDGEDDAPLGSIEIYQISREAFTALLENCAPDDLRKNADKCHKCPDDGANYITSAVTLFRVTSELTDFLGNASVLQAYLAENNIDGAVEDTLIFDAPHMPLSVRIQTDAETVYLTVNEFYDDTWLVYRLYRKSDYSQKFKSREARLLCNGEDILNGKSVTLYYGYADLPFTAICTALGAEVTWESETAATIRYNGNTYTLDAAHDSLCDENGSNLLHAMTGGSPYYKYMQNGEFYMDSDILGTVLLQMGEKITVNCDTEQNTVNIVSR